MTQGLNILYGLNGVRDTYVREAELLALSGYAATGGFRRAWSRVTSSGWFVAALCAVVSLGVVGAIVMAGRGGPDGPILPAGTGQETQGVSSESVDGAEDTSPSETETDIDWSAYTQGLQYGPYGDVEGECCVQSIGTATDTILKIPPVSPDGQRVVAVGANAFYGNRAITEVILPDTVRILDNASFAGCTYLRRVTVGKEFEVAGAHAFNGCLSLTELNVTEAHRLMHYAVYQTPWINHRPEEFVIFQNMLVQYNGAGGHVTVPDGVTVINSAAFRENTEITSVTVPDTCSYIGEAFMGCTTLETVDLPPSVKVLNCSFSGCTSLRSIDLSFVEEMGGGTFQDCTSLTEVDLSSVTFMGYWVFMGCTSLHTVTFPADGLEAIHGQSFAKTALTEVILPDSVKTLGDEVFALCPDLTRVETAAETVGNACFNSCASLEEIVFKDGLTTLGSGVFCNSPSLRRIEIPNTLSYVGDNGNLTLPELVIAYKGTEAQFGKVTFEVANKQYNYRNFTRYVVFEEEETEA